MRRLYALLIIPLLLGLTFGYGLGYTTWGEKANLAENSIVVTPVLRVYKNGELILEKVGDPPTDNLALLWLFTVAPPTDTAGNSVVVTLVDFTGAGDSFTANVTDVQDPRLLVLAGTGTAAPSYNDYTMQAVAWAEAQLVSLSFDTTNTAWVMQITGAITFSASATISEVGLAVEIYNGTHTDPLGTGATFLYLVFRDVLAQSISVVNGDVLEIQYTITVDLP